MYALRLSVTKFTAHRKTANRGAHGTRAIGVKMRNLRYRTLGDLPYDRDQGGQLNRPSGGLLYGEWANRYTASLYPFVTEATAQQIIPANARRAYLLVQNKDGASDMFINFGQKASVFASVIIIPGGNFEFVGGSFGGAFVPMDSVWVLGGAVSMNGVLVEGVLPIE